MACFVVVVFLGVLGLLLLLFVCLFFLFLCSFWFLLLFLVFIVILYWGGEGYIFIACILHYVKKILLVMYY